MEGTCLKVHAHLDRRKIVMICALAVTLVLGTQLLAVTAWTADAANTGPRIALVKLSNEKNVEWAMDDLIEHLNLFICDDPWLRDRITIIETNNPRDAIDFSGHIVVYVSHGGMSGILTGDTVTSWPEMAGIVSESKAGLHLFAACFSKEIVKYGDENSGKMVYSVPGARPAEITNLMIVSAIKIALGHDVDTVTNERHDELSQLKEMLESGGAYHLLDFEQVILNELDAIDADYTENYNEQQVTRYLRGTDVTTWSSTSNYGQLPTEVRNLLSEYFPLGTLTELSIDYGEDWYTRENYEPEVQAWLPDVVDNHVFSGAAYCGTLQYSGDSINVTAGVSPDDGLTSIYLAHDVEGGVWVSQAKNDGVWQDVEVGRQSDRSGGSWVDSCSSVDYEYDSNWPYRYSGEASGTLRSNGEYLYVTDIPSGYGWHGPSFVRTLPSYFKLADLDAFSSNMSILQDGVNQRMSVTCVSLYDENEKMVISLQIYDNDANSLRVRMRVRFFREDESYAEHYTDYSYGDYNGVVTARYEPLRGVVASVPGKNDAILFSPGQINPDRLIKHAVIQSYRRYSYSEHDERIHHIQLSYADSEYTVFHDNCNDMDRFHEDNDFGWGVTTPGEFVVPDDQSYMRVQSIPDSPSGWHGPNFVHVLDRPFRLYQLSEFSVMGQLVQSSNTKGATYVGLFDENKQIALVVMFADAEVSIMKGYFKTRFYSQNGAYSYQSSGYIYNSGFTKTGRLWWGEGFGGDGAIYSSIDGSGDAYPIGECDNASRVIKYVALRGIRYSEDSLVDMRIHDINVVADLTVLNPNAPTKHDGTVDGAGPEPEDELNPASQQFADQNLIFQWLQSWWPTLQITANAAFGVCTLVIDLTIDILGAMNVVTSNFGIQGINFDDPVVAQRVAQQVEQAQIDTSESGSHLTLATLAVIVSSWLVINWASYLVFMVCLGVWSACMFKHLWALYHNYANGYTTVGDTLMGIGLIMAVWLVKLLGFLIIHGELAERVKGILTSIFGKVNAVAMQAAKWTLRIAAVLWLLVMVYEIGAIASTQPMNAIFVAPSWVT
jgi:hypothetical protein